MNDTTLPSDMQFFSSFLEESLTLRWEAGRLLLSRDRTGDVLSLEPGQQGAAGEEDADLLRHLLAQVMSPSACLNESARKLWAIARANPMCETRLYPHDPS